MFSCLTFWWFWGISNKKWTQQNAKCDISDVYPGISEVTTAVHTSNTEHDEEAVEVTFTCSATGKPLPTIQWDLSSHDLNDSQAQTTTLTNSDYTFTSSGNISLRVPSDWKGYVDCLVNTGMMGERRERIQLALDPRRKKKDQGTYVWMCIILGLLTQVCLPWSL